MPTAAPIPIKILPTFISVLLAENSISSIDSRFAQKGNLVHRSNLKVTTTNAMTFLGFANIVHLGPRPQRISAGRVPGGALHGGHTKG